MMTDSLILMYESGAITADHLVAQCIHLIDPDDPGLVLDDLPDAILDRMMVYTQKYQPNRMVSTYGPPPAADQVQAARIWIEDLRAMRGVGGDAEADWYRYRMEERIVEILRSYIAPAPVFQYSLTIYQIAIEFARRFEPDFRKMGRPLGGIGAGNRALTVYMARRLSERIKARKTDKIEVQYLHYVDTNSLVYAYKDEKIIAATPAAKYPVQVYRLRPST